MSRTKEQAREHSRKWRAEHQEQVYEGNRKYREANQEKINKYQRDWYRKNRDRLLPDRQRYHLEHRYGLTPDRLLLLKEAQHGACAICGNGPGSRGEFDVDHDHRTGVVRGLLCHSCNVMLGASKDDQGVMKLAIEYLSERG